MATVQLKLGPSDHGRRLTLDDFEEAEYAPGFRYEIIDGRLYVSPEPNPKENVLEEWIGFHLRLYSRGHSDVVNYVTAKSRVFVHARPEDTVPEPDLTAYRGFPLDQDYDDIRWEEQSPVLVVEVMTGSEVKDLRRNVALYFEVPSIREYWVLDGRLNPNQPTLIQHRRYGKRWVVREFPYATPFGTKLLPGFQLIIDPRQ